MSWFKVKLLMFDLDGTLLHTAPQIAAAANLMLADLGRQPLPISQIQNYIGDGALVLIKRCLTQQKNTETEPALFVQAEAQFFAHYAKNCLHSLPFYGVHDGLQTLHKGGYKLACVTNKPTQFTVPLLQKSGLADYFEMVVSGDTLEKKKPDPMQLQYICAKLGVVVADALFVGDSNTDIAAARAAGCYIVTVPYGYNQGHIINADCVDAKIDNLKQLSTFLI